MYTRIYVVYTEEWKGGEGSAAIHNTDVDTNDRVLPTGILRYIG